MAVRIFSNPTSLVAQNNLTRNASSLGKSIERLSSGLRINHASDDASGMAVSEKIKAQIKGYQVASRNTQDGISYLQTAEGGTEIVGSMLQRMRELAVQAANGIYTATDRVELQKEVDQLKSEINRVTSSTEFNTKKLLNGNATALWSADSKSVSAIISGKVDAGNYEVKVTSTPGKGAVYSSLNLQLKQGAFAAGVYKDTPNDKDNPVELIQTNSDLIGNLNHPTVGSQVYTLHIGSKAGTAVATLPAKSFTLGTHNELGSTTNVKFAGSNVKTAQETGYVEFRVIDINDPSAPINPDSMTTHTSVGDFFKSGGHIRIQYNFHNAKNGAESGWQDAKVLTAGVTPGGFKVSVKNTAIGLQLSYSVVLSTAVAANNKPILGLREKDSWVFAIQGKYTGSDADRGGAYVSIDGGVANHSVKSGLYVKYGVGEFTALDNNDGKVDYNKARIYAGHFDAQNGIFEFGGFDMLVREQKPKASAANTGYAKTSSGVVSIFVNGQGQNATKTTRLSDIKNFINSDGKNAFSTDQDVALYANGKNEHIMLEANDTLQDVDTKFTQAMVKMSLGATPETVFPVSVTATVDKINEHMIDFVEDRHDKYGTDHNMSGTMLMQTTLMGSQSHVSLVGEEDVINGFGFRQINTDQNSVLNVKVYDMKNNRLVGEDNVENNKLDNVIGGVRLKLDSRVGTVSRWNDDTQKIDRIQTNATGTLHLHIISNNSILQTGPNEAQNLDISIPQLNTSGLNIDDAYIYDQDVASKAITQFDLALRKVASVRATIGAQVNRLTYTTTNLDTMRQNLVASNSRIEDADIAEESSELQKNQVLQQAAQSMVSQAGRMTQQALSLLQQ